MIWENFKEMFHESWHSKLKPWIESEQCDNIYKFLKEESKRGKRITPLSSDVFRCFKLTPFDELKMVLMGICPYHTFKNGEPVADGLLMSCSRTGILQPSLEMFYKGLEKEFYDGINVNINKTPDLSYLAEQGVLLFNAALTTEINKPGSHLKLWEPFVEYLFTKVLDVTGVPIVYLGKDAAKCNKYYNPFTWQFYLSHPASAAYNFTDWDSENIFTSVNRVLKGSNNVTINWLKINKV